MLKLWKGRVSENPDGQCWIWDQHLGVAINLNKSRIMLDDLGILINLGKSLKSNILESLKSSIIIVHLGKSRSWNLGNLE